MGDKSAGEPLCTLADIGEGGKEVRVDGEDGVQWLMLFRRDGELTAWRNVCPHQGRPLSFAPDKFLFTPDGRLVCAHHGACFELPSGQCVDGPCKGAHLTPVAITVDSGSIYLGKPQEI